MLELGGGRFDASISREDYERSSRAARFQFYRDSLEKHGVTKGGLGGGIMLAHHLGDVEENVISNVMHGALPDCLSGMREVGTMEGCNVWRPLLPWRKDAILDFAHTFGVPYFLDSTPSWSTRFALRRKLLPVIRDTYGEGAHRNLASLAQSSDALHDEIESQIVRPFIASNVTFGPLGVRTVVIFSFFFFSPGVACALPSPHFLKSYFLVTVIFSGNIEESLHFFSLYLFIY